MKWTDTFLTRVFALFLKKNRNSDHLVLHIVMFIDSGDPNSAPNSRVRLLQTLLARVRYLD